MAILVQLRLALLCIALTLVLLASVAADAQLPCNPGTYGGMTALATNSGAQTICNRKTQCYGSSKSNPAACTFLPSICALPNIIPFRPSKLALEHVN